MNRNHSRGFSLIEMLVVIALSAILLGVATSLIFSLRERDRHVRENGVRADQVFRLAESLRADIREGADVLLSIDGPLVVMSPSGEQVRYELTREGCNRSAAPPGETKSPGDLFRIGTATRWNVERLATGRRPLVAVTLEQPLENDMFRTAPLVVYAALGADLPPAEKSE